ncbi:MAG: choice-of-anchor D domain-containing protein [Burkholderiales bacterium]|nr:choice-of-anchor D domain-containing protein [Burkholderiales bacterium]
MTCDHRLRLKTLAVATAMALSTSAGAVTFTVTNASDLSTTGTLRFALQQIAADTGCTGAPYLIQFNIPTPPTGPITIPVGQLTSGTTLPAALCETVIDGYTQPGSSPNTIGPLAGGSNAVIRIVLDGTSVLPVATAGINLGGSNSLVSGLSVVNFPNAGILVSGFNSLVAGNFVGVLPNGAAAPNGSGIDGGFSAAQVGLSAPADRNVVSANAGGGIRLGFGGSATNNLVGVAPDGSTPRGNGSFGVSANFDGGNIADNRVAHNQKGIVSTSNFNAVFSNNEIYSNSLIGIDLGNDGPTPNDPLDTDVGANGLQNSPVFADVTYGGGLTTFSVTLNSNASSSPYSIAVYGNDDALGQGKFPTGCGAGGLATDAVGNAGPVAISCPGIIKNPTAIATGPQGSSEFSAPFLTPDMSPSTNTLNFGTVPVGGSSAVMPLTITNPGAGDLYIDAMSLSLADYKDTTGGAPSSSAWCGIGSDASGAPLSGPSAIPVPAGNDCVLNLVFAPQNSGSRSATLTLIDAQSPANGTVINLLGSGSVTPPTVNLAFSPISVLQNIPSKLSLSITNNNGATFANSSFSQSLPANLVIAATPNETNPAGPSCAGSFATPSPGASSFTINGLQVMTGATCTFSLDLSSATVGSYPVTTAAGAIVGTVLAVPVSNATSNTAILTVNPPAAPAVQLTPGGLNFGSVTVGTPAPPQSALLQNVGTANLVFSGISLTPGDFTQTNTCPIGPPGLPPLANCAFAVNFTPTATGTRSADITIATNAATSPNILPLTGNGVAVPVAIPSLLPSALTFPTQTVGTTSAAQAVTLSNAGTAPLAISSIITEGDFAQSNACPSSLAPSASCGISVTFSPVAPGTRSGFLKVFDDAAGSPHFIPLTGTATLPPVPTISAPASVSFPPTQVGGVSPPVTVTISNVGGGPLSIAAVEVVGSGYAVTSQTCTSAPVTPSGSCTISMTFAPGSAGNVVATLRLISNAPASPTLIGLTGEGTALAVGTLAATPATLDFGTREIGTTTAAQSITVSNAGSAPVTVSGITASGDYAQTNDCSLLESAATCTISITFTPTATGPRPGSVSVASNASNSPLTVNLSGTGAPIQAPVIELSASSLGFGNRLVGAGAQVQSVTVRNRGGAPLALGSITLTGEFVHTTTCGATVEPDGTCRIDVGFLPTIPGARFGRMTVTSNASNGTQFVDLAGTGCRFTFFNRTQSLICQ